MFSTIKYLKHSNFNRILPKFSVKLFGSNHSAPHDNHSHTQEVHHNNHASDHGDHHGDHHGDDHGDDHGDHHHHEITGEVDINRVYVPLNKENKRFISLSGLPSDKDQEHLHIEGEYKAQNAITPISIPFITQSRKRYKRLANVSDEENPYLHPEPYGYLVADDPFDPNPSLWQRSIPLIAIFFGMYATLNALKQTNGKDSTLLVEKIFYAHHMAGLIEDEIRQIRRVDYPYRKKYEELKSGPGVEENPIEESE